MFLYDNDIRNLCYRVIAVTDDKDTLDLLNEITVTSDMWYEMIRSLTDETIMLKQQIKEYAKEFEDAEADEYFEEPTKKNREDMRKRMLEMFKKYVQ